QNKEVLGSQLSHEQVKGLTDDEAEKFYKRYEAYIGSKTTETLLQRIFMLASKLRNGRHMRYLPMQRRCYQKFLRQNLQTLGELQLEKKLAERNGLGCEAKKNQKPPDAPAEEKEKSENPSGGVNSYLLLGIGGLVVSVVGVYYEREAIMTTLR
ncbi:unnamed protein product, partial [Porites lobata]